MSTQTTTWMPFASPRIGAKVRDTLRTNSQGALYLHPSRAPFLADAPHITLAYDHAGRIALRAASAPGLRRQKVTPHRSGGYIVSLRAICAHLGYPHGTTFTATVEDDTLVLTPTKEQAR